MKNYYWIPYSFCYPHFEQEPCALGENLGLLTDSDCFKNGCMFLRELVLGKPKFSLCITPQWIKLPDYIRNFKKWSIYKLFSA